MEIFLRKLANIVTFLSVNLNKTLITYHTLSYFLIILAAFKIFQFKFF